VVSANDFVALPQEEAKREAYLQRRFSIEELIEKKLNAIRALVRLNPLYRPHLKVFSEKPGAVNPPMDAEALLNKVCVEHQTALKVIKTSLSELQRLRAEHPTIFPNEKASLYPAPYFGDPFRARILTVGLNPSHTEFDERARWNPNMEPNEIAARLYAYFHPRVAPMHRWFEPLEKGLLYVGCSYERDAAHVDLCPYPAIWPRKMKPDAKKIFSSLVCDTAQDLRSILSRCVHVKLIIVVDYPMKASAEQSTVVSETFLQLFPQLRKRIVDENDCPCFLKGATPRTLESELFNNRHKLRNHLANADMIQFE